VQSGLEKASVSMVSIAWSARYSCRKSDKINLHLSKDLLIFPSYHRKLEKEWKILVNLKAITP
jgi:hypothetical protein